ncbi:MAG: 4-(cytidine 5'-diphospho)-2-C-methyl-D-erythritol kinase [Hyphomicrobiaceae bacterium]|nr:4-(cytidine 5'-diphospho)-2-C-methyl-D-erythritol kinase [Hyphomicrobiaceae bacterium]
MSVLVEIARPKVNLTLRILGRRADGYHALASLVAFAAGMTDRVTLDCRRARGVTVIGPFASSITDTNLLETTLDLVAAADPDVRLGHVTLEKNLPVAAGIGGGSADAGALLRALLRANVMRAASIEWQAISLRLGADVPVCLFNRAAWMTGIGERITAMEELPRLDAILVNPLAEVPNDKTAQVFRALAAPPLSVADKMPSAPAVASREALIDHINGGNDLEAAAKHVMPAIDEVLSTLRATPGCRVAAMSGAGPTCFGIFDDAHAAAASLAMRHPKWWIAPVVLS